MKLIEWIGSSLQACRTYTVEVEPCVPEQKFDRCCELFIYSVVEKAATLWATGARSRVEEKSQSSPAFRAVGMMYDWSIDLDPCPFAPRDLMVSDRSVKYAYVVSGTTRPTGLAGHVRGAPERAGSTE